MGDLFNPQVQSNGLVNESGLFNNASLFNQLDNGQPSALAVPSAPRNLSASAINNGTSVVLSWIVPSITGSSSISYYKVFQVVGQTYTLVTTTSSLTATIPNTIPFNYYMFAVQAVNSENLSGTNTFVSLNTMCFKKGTKILYWDEEKLQEEYIAIERLRKGMKVKTALDGFVKIELLCKSEIYNSVKEEKNKDCVYKLEKHLYPELHEDLYITGAHSILVDELTDEQRAEIISLLGDIYITGDKYRLPACLDKKAKPSEEEGFVEVWHLALENENYSYNYGIYANGLLVETCSIRFIKELSNSELIE